MADESQNTTLKNPVKSDLHSAKLSNLLSSVPLSVLVKLLIDKGVFTLDELVTANRDYLQQVSARNHQADHKQLKKPRETQSFWKRLAAKYKWSRRLTARLFGWHWKKVVIKADVENV